MHGAFSFSVGQECHLLGSLSGWISPEDVVGLLLPVDESANRYANLFNGDLLGLVADLWCRILQQAVASLLHACRTRGRIVG